MFTTKHKRKNSSGFLKAVDESYNHAKSRFGSSNNDKQIEIESSECHKGCQEVIASLRKKLEQLRNQLINTKIFLDMVVHEMRNPATAIQMGLGEILVMLDLKD